ncbi:MAG: hypothetical protein ACJ71P_03975 [Nitrososphaeraceae archaeon]
MVFVRATTFSLVAVSMLTIQEASAAKQCNNNDDDTNNHNNDDSKTCAKQQQQSKNHDPSISNTKNSIPFRLPMPFP